MTISGNGTTAITYRDTSNEISVWDLTAGRLLRTLRHQVEGPVLQVIVDQSSTLLISLAQSLLEDENALLVWDLSTGNILTRLKGPGGMAALGLSGNTLAAASAGGVIQVWDLKKGTPLTRVRHDAFALRGLTDLRVTSDETRVVEYGVNNNTSAVRVSRIREDGAAVHFWTGPVTPPLSSTAHEEAVATGQLRMRWEPESELVVEDFASTQCVATWARASADGFQCIATRGGGVAELWDLRTGSRISVVQVQSDCTASAISADGSSFAIGTRSGEVAIFGVTKPG